MFIEMQIIWRPVILMIRKNEEFKTISWILASFLILQCGSEFRCSLFLTTTFLYLTSFLCKKKNDFEADTILLFEKSRERGLAELS